MNPVMLVNLDNLIYNIYSIKDHTKKEIIAVIKSDAYGLNVKYIVPILKKCGIKFFLINRLYELLDLKTYLEGMKIIIYESLKINEYKTAYQLTKEVRFTISSLNDVYNIIQFINQCNPTLIFVHIFIDTGMHRFGFNNQMIVKKAIDLLSNYKNIIIEGIYTHYAKKDPLNELTEFLKYIYLYPFTIIHASSSRQIITNTPIIGNYIRIGMLLYSQSSITKNVINVLTKPLKTILLENGDSLGYDLEYKNSTCEKEEIDIIPLGYYEGMIEKDLVVGKRCMNHSFIRHINNTSFFLKIFPIHDKIINDNYYKKFMSYQNIKKVYISSYGTNISKVNQKIFTRSKQIRKRKRSH